MVVTPGYGRKDREDCCWDEQGKKKRRILENRMMSPPGCPGYGAWSYSSM